MEPAARGVTGIEALDPQAITMTLLSGAVVGLFLGAFGGGGSVLAAPLLLYAVGVADTHVALGTSAAGVAAIALFNLAGHWRAGRVKWPCALAFSGTGLLGAVVGSTLAKATDDAVLLLAFAFAMFAVALAMFRKPKSSGNADVTFSRAIGMKLVPAGVSVGAASGFFGIGGGFLIVPGLMATTGMTIGHAAAASLVSVAAFGTATSVNYAISGLVSIPIVLLMLGGGALGGLLGLKVAALLRGKEQTARQLFATMIILVAIYVGIDAGLRVFS